MKKQEKETWMEVDPRSDFSIWNIPFGIYSDAQVPHRVCSAIGDYIIDLYELASEYYIETDKKILESKYLNDFISLGKPATKKVRQQIIDMLTDESSPFITSQELFNRVFKKRDQVDMLMP